MGRKLKGSDGKAESLKDSIDSSLGLKEVIIRAQKVGTANLYSTWTLSVIKGNATVAQESGGDLGSGDTNQYITAVLHDFTQAPFSVRQFLNNSSSDPLIGSSEATKMQFNGLDFTNSSGFWYLTTNNTALDLLTNYTPSQHKFMWRIMSTQVQDYYFQFIGM